ncbi:hypothetical protein EJ08DRAFT_658500 [Tothia fuscella]|uniref:Uncharacterized protein n=1 Tax=Tothia fuscella TaxID=1048955 RepID=A0A9P4U0Z6_9PEZI|nr:hypothetical protein EJ08DRAFT_658500 [Tothia fuscella]
MLVSSIFSFCIGVAVAAPAKSLVQRDLAAFRSAFGAISSATTTFDTAVKGIASPADVNANLPDLTTKAGAIVTAIQNGITTVNAQPPLSLTDSLSLLTLSNTLVSSVEATVSDLTDKKPFVDAATPPQTTFVRTQLQDVRSNAQTYIAAVVAKVPDAVKSVANTQASRVITVLDNGIATYSG